jgi:hypothetical protein
MRIPVDNPNGGQNGGQTHSHLSDIHDQAQVCIAIGPGKIGRGKSFPSAGG